MDYIRSLIKELGFTPKENVQNIYDKTYPEVNACIEINFANEQIIYDKKIRIESKTIQNFSRPENFVVLECINQLLETGYKPENIILEKTYPLGLRDKGRLDILVTKTHEDGKEESYLMIECKTSGKEYDKGLANMQKNGGQLLSYFQQDKSAELLILYASEYKSGKIEYQNEIIPVTEEIRNAKNTQEMFKVWDKNTKTSGIWKNTAYNFQAKALTIDQLIPLAHAESSKIFNGFLEILRHNVVSDKPNAFNKIFSLFLCKIYDELEHDTEHPKDRNAPLDFQYIEGETDEVFQLRLNDLYKRGMQALLGKTITDISLQDFDTKYKNFNEKSKQELWNDIIKLRLQKNNEFAIKDVFDEDSFQHNAVVVKEVVQLLEKYRIRYTHKNQFLSDFFELLLTTGLKQEAGQFFTSVPIAQFILKRIPLDKIIEEKLQQAEKDNYLPRIIDYASGSGHFLTESMDIIQNFLEHNTDSLQLQKSVRNFVNNAKNDNYNWADEYIYGIEKDYRLVKVGKVGCYLHGDGLANVIHSDGLARFSHEEYQDKLQKNDKDFPKENKQFDIVVSNPPYSVSGFKNVTSKYYNQNDFELYKYLTEQSSEIEALFVERTKQLLKDGGTAGVILPNSILSNTGIYTKAREIILKYFEIIAITELGSNTFMATETNTVVLFLRRRNNYEVSNLMQSVEQVFQNRQDVTLNGIENSLSKYVAHVWKIAFGDYVSLLKKLPNKTAETCELFREYRKKLFIEPKKSTLESLVKAERDFWEKLLKIEREKFLYFLLSYDKKVVLINSGQKNEEKQFLGYEFSNRRGNEGIHPIKKGNKPDGTPLTISDCTKLFDENAWENPKKANTYVYKAFLGEYPEIHESLQKHISHTHLHDMLTFDRVDFDKLISTSIKKKIVFESKWDLVRLGEVVKTQYGFTEKAHNEGKVQYLRITDLNDDGSINLQNEAKFINPSEEIKMQFLLKENDIVIARSGSVGKSAIYKTEKYSPMIFASYLIRLQVNNQVLPGYVFNFTKTKMYWAQVEENKIGITQPNLNAEKIKSFILPIPPLKIQQKIVSEIETLEKVEQKTKNEIKELKDEIEEVMRENVENKKWEMVKLGEVAKIIRGVTYSKRDQSAIKTSKIILTADNITLDGTFNIKKKVFLQEDYKISEEKKLTKSDIFICFSSGSKEHLGKVAFIEQNKNYYAGGFMGIIRTESFVVSKYLFQLLNGNLRQTVRNTGNCSNINNLSGVINDIKLPLPPLSVQQEIVSEIEKLEAKIAQLESRLKEIPQKKEDILKKWL